MKFEWENIYSKGCEENDAELTERAKVPGGWLIKHHIWIKDKNKNEAIAVSTSFIPDIKHAWSLE